jgi:CRISP-associated protein Cas1
MAQRTADVADVVSLTADELSDGQQQLAATYADDSIGQTVVLDGFGVSLRVNRGQLVCTDGEGTQRRERRISRSQAAAGQIRRLLVLGDGMVTTEAIAWCHHVGIGLVVCDRDATPLHVGGPRLYEHGSLTQAQALAAVTGIRIVRSLLDRRLADQARITRELLHRDDRATAIEALRTALTTTTGRDEAVVIEMRAADHYWAAAWTDAVRLTFAAKDRPRVPQHWLSFGGRSSPLGEATSNRHAATPTNAMINFGMRLAEIEATLACHAFGLDPYIGLAHANQPHRPAFVLDLMEPVRGIVEETIWQLTVSRTFRKADFSEAANGEVRLLAPFTHTFAAALLTPLRVAVAPVAERVAQTLLASADDTGTVPTALSRRKHKAARAARGDRAREERTVPTASAQLWTCPQCGSPVTENRHVRCQACIDADPRQTTEIRGRRAKAIAARKRTYREWEQAGGIGDFDPTSWDRIATGLKKVRLRDIMNATGLSKSFASTVRTGKWRPHVSHWPALAALAGQEARSSSARAAHAD